VADICAFANTNGGTIYLGVSANPAEKPVGIDNLQGTIDTVRNEVDKRIAPALPVEIDTMETQSKKVIRIQVPRGDDPPYVIDDNKVYVRDESETTLAVRDEIVGLVLGNPTHTQPQVEAEQPPAQEPVRVGSVEPPRTGVEIV